MKKYLIASIVIIVITVGCLSENSDTEIRVKKPNQEQDISEDVPQSEDETKIELTFSSGILKGTHVFKSVQGDVLSQINVGFDRQVSTLSAMKLVSEDGKHQLVITRPFQGEAVEGSHKAKNYTNDCGTFKLRSLIENGNYSTIRGTYKNCSNTNVSICGAWKEGYVYNSRGIVADFEDDVELEVAFIDGTVVNETAKMSVLFKGIESRLMIN